jgi:biopolymer transport protein ExbD
MEFEGRARIREQLSMAPLIDVVFLLLLFFMLTSSFVDPEAVELALPESHTSAPSEERSIRVAVDADGVVYLDDEPIALAALEPAIAAALGVDPDATVSLSTDAELRVQQMLAVIDEIRAAGAERLSFVAQGVGEAPGAGATD